LEIFPSPFTEPLHHGYEAQISVFASRLADPVRFKSSGDVPAVGQPWSNTSTLCVGNDAFVDRLTLPQRRCLEAGLCHRLLRLLVAASREPSPRAAALQFAAWKVSISLCYNQQTSRIGVCPGAMFDAEVLHADLSLLVPPRDDYSKDGRRLAPVAPRSQYNPAFEGLARFGNFLEQLGMYRDAAKVYQKKHERGCGIDACRESARAHGFAGDFEEARDACVQAGERVDPGAACGAHPCLRPSPLLLRERVDPGAACGAHPFLRHPFSCARELILGPRAAPTLFSAPHPFSYTRPVA
jgi:hypothetical protein